MNIIIAGSCHARLQPILRILPQALLIVFFLGIAISPTFAVEVKGRIRGTVADPRGSVVPNVTVTATNQDTGVAIDAHRERRPAGLRAPRRVT